MDHEGRTCLSYAKAALSLSSAHLTNEPAKPPVDASLQLNTIDATKTLVEMLENLGCSDPLPNTSAGLHHVTVRPSVYEKLQSSVM